GVFPDAEDPPVAPPGFSRHFVVARRQILDLVGAIGQARRLASHGSIKLPEENSCARNALSARRDLAMDAPAFPELERHRSGLVRLDNDGEPSAAVSFVSCDKSQGTFRKS